MDLNLGGAVPVPKVVVDRYKKKIKQEDILRGQANYGKAAAAGALAGLVARFKNARPSHRAAIGAGAGLLAEGIVRAAGRATKDPYGERSHTAKTAERLPAALGVTLAGGLAYKRVRRALKDFSENAQRPTLNAQRPITEFSISPSLREKLITALALSGGITAADAATRATFTKDDRQKAAIKGAKEGAVYGSVLAGAEPFISGGLRKIARKFHDRRRLTEFRYYNEPYLRRSGITEANGEVRDKPRFERYVTRKDKKAVAEREDLSKQRRRLALYAGGALAVGGGLAILARGGGGTAHRAVATVKPAGRGTLDRLAMANKLRSERGYVHMKPMAPGQRKRFDKLPAQTQVNAGKVAQLATHPQLSPGERQKMRQWMGRIRATHKFSGNVEGLKRLSVEADEGPVRFVGRVGNHEIYFSSFVKDIRFKDLPSRARVDIRAFHPGMKSNTRLAHYGMTTKELASKADPHNLAAARKNVGNMSRKACADEVYQNRGKKFVLLNNDKMVDGHHYVAKAERGRVTASLHVIDLTPSRFQTALERVTRAVEFARGDYLNRLTSHAAISGPTMRKIVANEPFGILRQRPLQAVGRMEWLHNHIGQGKRIVIPRGATAAKQISKGVLDDYRAMRPYLKRIGFERRLRNPALRSPLRRAKESAVEFAQKQQDDTFKHDVAVGSIEGGAGVLATDRLIRRFAPEGSLAARKILIGAGVGGLTTAGIGYGLAKLLRKRQAQNGTQLERRLRNAVEFVRHSSFVIRHLPVTSKSVTGFMYAEGGAMPGGDLPEWVQMRRKNQKHRERLHTAAQVAGVAGGAATVGAAVHSILARKKAVKSLKDYLKGVGLERKSEVGNRRAEVYFRRREQLREGGKTEAEKGSGRFVDPIAVSAGLKPAYAITAGGDRRFYGGVHGGDLAITHAQVLRSAYTHGGALRKYAHRAGNLVRDAADVAVGNPRRADNYGRPQRREWEKPWFGRAVKDAAIGATILGGVLALKKSPRLRGKVMSAGANIRRKVNQMVPDLLADWGPGIRISEFGSRKSEVEFASVPFKFGGKIDYARQNALYDWAKQLRRAVRRKAGLPLRPPIAGSLPAKPGKIKGFNAQRPTSNVQRPMIEFDDIANWAGWDVRDPRGRSARVFAPGSRKRMRREKEWHEKIDVQRRLLGALAAVGTAAGAGAGILIGRKIYRPKPLPNLRKVITAVTPKHPFGGGHVPA